MRNLILLLGILSGLGGGYFLGDIQGKKAREDLERAVKTGETLANEREIAISGLKKDLDAVTKKYEKEIQATREDYVASKEKWQKDKTALDDTLKSLGNKLDERKQAIAALNKKLNESTNDTEKEQLKQEAARQKKIIADLQEKFDGNACLKTKVPDVVFKALGAAS